MSRFKIVYSYDGSSFSGSQKQPGKRTVQGELEKVVQRIEKDVAVVPSGRTDMHVHALAQVAHIDISIISVTARNLQEMFDRQLPKDIKVTEVELVNETFHARFNCRKKTYHYYFKVGSVTPFNARYVNFIGEDFSIEKMNCILNNYVGTHDFTAFTVTRRHHKDASNVRTLHSCFCYFDEVTKNYVFVLTGDGFLQYMVRILVGFAFLILKGKEPVEKISELFETKDAHYVHVKEEPNGLYLAKVEYD